MPANKIKPNIVAKFSEIGRSNGTSAPSKNNVTALLHEYFVANTLSSIAKARVDNAKAAVLKFATENGFDPTKVQPGDTVTVIGDNPDYFVTLKVNNPPETFNIDTYNAELVKAGVPKNKLDKAYVLASGKGTPAKLYSIIPVES